MGRKVVRGSTGMGSQRLERKGRSPMKRMMVKYPKYTVEPGA